MTLSNRTIGYAFATFYLYLIVALILSVTGYSPVPVVGKSLVFLSLLVFVAVALWLFVVMIFRLLTSPYSIGTKLLWCVLFFVMSIVGATAFFAFDMYRRSKKDV